MTFDNLSGWKGYHYCEDGATQEETEVQDNPKSRKKPKNVPDLSNKRKMLDPRRDKHPLDQIKRNSRCAHCMAKRAVTNDQSIK